MNRELKQEKKKGHLTYFLHNSADTPSERPYHPVWREMGIAISSTEQVSKALLKGIKAHKRVILMGQATKFFARLNLLSPSIADHLLLKRYGRILKKYFG